jgi:hypothetical protein
MLFDHIDDIHSLAAAGAPFPETSVVWIAAIVTLSACMSDFSS